MSSNQKLAFVAVALGGFVLAGCLACGAGLMVLDWGNDLVAIGDQQANEGAQFGRDASERGCVDEALRRTDRDCGGIDVSCYAGGEEFLTACLRAAPALDPHFCDGVPPDTFVDSMNWAGDECGGRGYPEGHGCEQVVHGVIRHCASGMRAPRGDEPAAPPVGQEADPRPASGGTGPGSSAP